jgi:hypothetical protein
MGVRAAVRHHTEEQMQFFIELLLWHLIIAAFLVGALALSRGTRQPKSRMTFTNDPSGD